ncbi:MAG: hypothetical protein J6D21_12275 [Clostridia bacterium]|nr:hypothetical protein [Clostridia bacterium]
MILEQKQTLLAYRCPHCGCVVTGLVGSFALNADMLRLKCECGNSEALVVKTHEGKIRITVPCLVCPKPHTYLVNTSLFFEKELFVLNCSLSGLDLCFIGGTEEVAEAIEASNAALIEMLGGDEAALENLKQINQEKDLTDPQVLEIVMFVIHDLAEAGEIECRCQHGGNYAVDIHDDCVVIQCTECGAEAKISTTSVGEANDFLGLEHLTLS